MAFFHVNGRLLNNRREGSGAFVGVGRRLQFDTARGWVTVPAASVPPSLAALAAPGTAGSFFFLGCFGRSLLFSVRLDDRGTAFALRAVGRARVARLIVGVGAIGLAAAVLPLDDSGALAALLALLGAYNLLVGALQGRAGAVRFVRSELDLPAPDGSLERS